MADDIKVNLKVVADPQGAAEAGKADAAAYQKAYKSGLAVAPPDMGKQDPFSPERLKDFHLQFAKIRRLLAEGLRDAGKEFKPLPFEDAAKKLRNLISSEGISGITKEQALKIAADWEKSAIQANDAVEKSQIASEKKVENERKKADADKERRNTRYMKATESLIKNSMFLSAPFVGFGRSFVARQTFDASRTERGKSIQSGLGLGTSIGGSLGLTAIAMALITAAELAQKGLQMLAQKAVESVRFSQANFAKAAISGFGMKGQTYRSIVSNILGVDEREIMRFGSALAYINPKIKTATETLQMNALPLAQLGIDLKILETKFLALGSTLATSLMPIIEKIINFASESADEMSQKADKWGDAAKMAFKALGNMLSGMSPEDAATKAKLDVLSSKTEKGKYGLAAPVPFMKQMPASAWEKMGLVIGGGVGTNYGKQTADNTKNTVKVLHQIAAKIGVGDRGQAAIYSLP